MGQVVRSAPAQGSPKSAYCRSHVVTESRLIGKEHFRRNEKDQHGPHLFAFKEFSGQFPRCLFADLQIIAADLALAQYGLFFFKRNRWCIGLRTDDQIGHLLKTFAQIAIGVGIFL